MKSKSTFRYSIVFLFILLNSFSQQAKAQMVYIPDINFKATLIAQGFGSSIVGDSIDSTSSAVFNDTILAIGPNINDLTGISAFVNLKYLDCSHNQLTSLPILPNGLLYLDCYFNKLSSLPVLPNGILHLNCNNNLFTSFSNLPPGLQYLNCDTNALTSLPTLPQYLDTLYCSSNYLTSLPILPNGLIQLNCSENQITSLPSLPNGLLHLDCSLTYITALPTLPNGLQYLRMLDNYFISSLPILPSSLQYLNCLACHQLTTLPLLPSGLQYLYTSQCNFSSIPVLPNTLLELVCDENKLTSLPTLPNGLLTLVCWGNKLLTLPVLPNSLEKILCEDDSLIFLPTLPSNLKMLSCVGNYLTSLPSLPSNLGYLDCSYNKLISLPLLPQGHLFSLICHHNLLTMLPDLPDSLYLECYYNPYLTCLPELKYLNYLRFDSALIACLPNYGNVNYSSPALINVPLCNFFNTNGCNIYWNISGSTYFDADTNCIYDAGDNRLSNYKIKLYKNNNLIQQAFSRGGYSFDTDTLGAYQTVIDTTGIPFTVRCPASFSYSDTLVVNDTLKYNRDFALECKPGFDLAAWSVTTHGLVPGHTATINNSVGDYSNLFGGRCASGIGGIVSIIYNGSIHYVSPDSGSLTPTIISGDTLTYAVADFGLVNASTAFDFLASVDTTATIGSPVCINVAVSPAVDNNPSNNTTSHCFTIHGSFDPNEKEVSPQSNLDINGDRWLTYTINFQNTGTAPAEHISILDTLNANLDVSTFQLLAYSKQPYVQILNGSIAKFNFPNINLPDSIADEANSHGYVQYRIKVLDSLVAGTPISNTAYIYFDFNAPVVTNTVIDSVIICPANIQNTTVTACANEYIFNGLHLTQSGNYTQKFTTNTGCDSIVNLALTLYPIYSTTVSQTLCFGDSINFGGQYISQNGNYSHSFTTAQGCDSIVLLNLTINQSTYNITGTFCSNSSYNFNGQNLTAAGIYVDSLKNILGCDSIIQLDLQLSLSYNDSISQSICYGDAVLFGSTFLTQPGVYTQTLPTITGCDSTTTLTLEVDPVYNINYTQTICSGETYFFNGQSISQSGVYTQTLATMLGCDSITTLTLSVQPMINNTVTQGHDTLTATETNAIYQWYDCVSGNSISGAFSQNFIPATSGYYAVILTNGNCIDSSLCQYISLTGINENHFSEISISPNPSSDEFIVSSPQKNDVSIKVFDAYGKIILQKQLNAPNTIIKAKSWSAGIYFMEISDGKNTNVRKLIKE